ncbi:hypothetical protein MNBD_GAMMA12-458 [hydrothermal vent metagenome]|uniref:DUF4124 domain-containing protein n=1 Tax=hydrothermal vent metagenome TaxID=652676 RepID=A0A3B0YEF2_9ZZZZ
MTDRVNRVIWILTVSFALTHNVANAEIYKWEVDGKVHYSDRPQIGVHKVKKLKLKKLSTHSPVTVNLSQTHITPERIKKDVSKTYGLGITSPVANQNFNGHAGNVTLRFSITPKLKSGAGHVIQYRIDEQSYSESIELEVTLDNIDRGAHQLFAKIVDNQGIDLSAEISVPFNVQRPSSLILQNLKNTNSAAPNLSGAKPVPGITAPPANPK